MLQNWFSTFLRKLLFLVSFQDFDLQKPTEIKLFRLWNYQKTIPHGQKLLGAYFKTYFDWKIMYVCYVCILCMYSMYVFYVCILCMYSIHVLYACILCKDSIHAFYVCILCVYSTSVFDTCIEYMYSIYVLYTCILWAFSRPTGAFRAQK